MVRRLGRVHARLRQPAGRCLALEVLAVCVLAVCAVLARGARVSITDWWLWPVTEISRAAPSVHLLLTRPRRAVVVGRRRAISMDGDR